VSTRKRTSAAGRVVEVNDSEYRDISYPRDWLEKMKKRSQAIQLTDREKAIVKALNERLTIEVEGKTFKEVLDDLRERTKMPIMLISGASTELSVRDDADQPDRHLGSFPQVVEDFLEGLAFHLNRQPLIECLDNRLLPVGQLDGLRALLHLFEPVARIEMSRYSGIIDFNNATRCPRSAFSYSRRMSSRWAS